MTQTENGNRYAITALKIKRAELAGEIAALKKKLEWAEDSLRHIDASLMLFEPTGDPTSVPARRPQKRVKLFRQGELSRMVVDALRRGGKPLSLHDIVSALLVEGTHSEEARPGLTPRVRSNLNYLESRKRVGKAGHGRDSRWCLRR